MPSHSGHREDGLRIWVETLGSGREDEVDGYGVERMLGLGG